eukprot:4722480-Amphidinium_carterae.3
MGGEPCGQKVLERDVEPPLRPNVLQQFSTGHGLVQELATESGPSRGVYARCVPPISIVGFGPCGGNGGEVEGQAVFATNGNPGYPTTDGVCHREVSALRAQPICGDLVAI